MVNREEPDNQQYHGGRYDSDPVLGSERRHRILCRQARIGFASTPIVGRTPWIPLLTPWNAASFERGDDQARDFVVKASSRRATPDTCGFRDHRGGRLRPLCKLLTRHENPGPHSYSEAAETYGSTEEDGFPLTVS